MKAKFSISVMLTATASLSASDLFWTTYHLGQSDGIYRADGNGNNVRQIISGDALTAPDYSYIVGLPMDLAVDTDRQEIYTVSTADDMIWKTDFTGSSFQEVLQVSGTDPHQLEADFANQHLYWLEDNGPGTPARIGRCDLDGSQPTYVITNAGARAGGMALDAGNGYLFWTESYYPGGSTNLAVWRCDLQGANARAIVTNFAADTFELGTIAVDPEAQKVYWLQDHSLIRRADYDGANTETLYVENALGDRSGLVIDTTADKLYWTSLEANTVGQATLDGSSNGPLITGLPSGPLGIMVIPGTTLGIGSPQLTLVQVDASSLTISWVQPSGGWQLESSPSLWPASWSAVASNRVTFDGTNGTATLALDQPGLFLRLHKVGP